MKSLKTFHWTVLVAGLLALPASGSEVGFSRIVHGWTNYSTGFNATHDPDPEAGDYVTVASFYTPDKYVRPSSYGVVLIWIGTLGQQLDFSAFDFQVHFWSGLAAFTNSPTTGDVATVTLAAPTGGSTTVRDTTTRGGRAAYYVTFSHTNTPLTLVQGHAYVVGFSALTDTSQHGEFYVPTARSAGPSDVQAGDLVPDDWQYLTNFGGSTIYSGQLATELLVEPLPQLRIERITNRVDLAWPAVLDGFALEASGELRTKIAWSPVSGTSAVSNGWRRMSFPPLPGAQFFRLRKMP